MLCDRELQLFDCAGAITFLRVFDRGVVMVQSLLWNIRKLSIQNCRRRDLSVFKLESDIQCVDLRWATPELPDINGRRKRFVVSFFVDRNRVAAGW